LWRGDRRGVAQHGAVEGLLQELRLGVMSAHSAEQIITVVTVVTADRPSGVAVALAVVAEALGRPATSPSQRADDTPARPCLADLGYACGSAGVH
jgi:hypothetical protein